MRLHPAVLHSAQRQAYIPVAANPALQLFDVAQEHPLSTDRRELHTVMSPPPLRLQDVLHTLDRRRHCCLYLQTQANAELVV
ncbi:hypothetical protein D3C75_1027590 [compost metagenome]